MPQTVTIVVANDTPPKDLADWLQSLSPLITVVKVNDEPVVQGDTTPKS